MKLLHEVALPAVFRDRRVIWCCLGAAAVLVATAVVSLRQPAENTNSPDEAPLAPVATATSRSGELRGVWMGPEGVPTWEETMQSLRSHNFNATFPWICGAGAAYYESSVLPVSPKVAAQGDALAGCVTAARRWGIEVHPRMLALTTYTATPAVQEAYRRAGRTVVGNGAEDGRWLCPTNSKNRAMLVAAALELATEYDVDGVQLDYIRYPSSRSCFCGTCRGAFERTLGRRTTDWPMCVASGELQARFIEWRCEQITSLVGEVRSKLRAADPRVRLSASVFNNWERHRVSYGQDWKRWVQDGLVDFVCPMDYTGDMSQFEQLVQSQVRWVEGAAPLYIGIGPYSDAAALTPEQVEEQIAISRRLGADGFVLFKYTEGLAASHLPLLWRSVATLPAGTPPHAVPELAFTFGDGVEIGGERYHAAGDGLTGTVALSGALTEGTKPRRIRLAAYQASGELVQDLGSAEVVPGGAASFEFDAPPGDLRIAAVFEREPGERMPAIKWSPLLRVRRLGSEL